MFSVRQNVSFVTNLHCVYVSLIYMANLSFFEFKISAFSVPDQEYTVYGVGNCFCFLLNIFDRVQYTFIIVGEITLKKVLHQVNIATEMKRKPEPAS